MTQKQLHHLLTTFFQCENASFCLVKDIYWLKHVGAHPNTLMQHQNIFMAEGSLKQLYRSLICEASKV